MTDAVRARRGSTARARIVAVLLGLLAVTVVLIVAITWTFLTVRDAHRIDAELTATGAEFNTLTATAVDPQTGKPFTSAKSLLQTAIEQAVPTREEERFAVFDGAVISRTTDGYPSRISADPEIVRAAAAATEPVLSTIDTDAGTVRYLAVPVSASDGRGAYVAAIVKDVSARQVTQITAIVAGVGLAGLVLAAAVGWVVAGRVLLPLTRLTAAATGITERDLSRRVAESGTDDVRALARAFNTMLDRLERAFASQRRFAADAGHELRTPLTVLRGHTELLSDDPEIRADQRAVLLDEIDRMSTMVEDLLALTRLDRAPELHPQVLAADAVVAQWRALAGGLAQRSWTWIAEGSLVADPQRLNQVFLQLAENALAVTGPGDAVEAGVVGEAGGATAWVADSGPGIPLADRGRIFEPFARGTVRSPGGSGLGLAIVAEIARAHGGSVEVLDARPTSACEPWPGGACVAVRLPPRPSEPGEPRTPGADAEPSVSIGPVSAAAEPQARPEPAPSASKGSP